MAAVSSSKKQYVLWEPIGGGRFEPYHGFSEAGDGTFTLDEIQQMLKFCQIDSTWKIDENGSFAKTPLREFPELNIDYSVAVVVHREDAATKKGASNLRRVIKRLERDRINYRIAYRSKPTAINADVPDPGDDFRPDVPRAYLADAGTVVLVSSENIAGSDDEILDWVRDYCCRPRIKKPLLVVPCENVAIPQDVAAVSNPEKFTGPCAQTYYDTRRALDRKVTISTREFAYIGIPPIILLGLLYLLMTNATGVLVLTCDKWTLTIYVGYNWTWETIAIDPPNQQLEYKLGSKLTQVTAEQLSPKLQEALSRRQITKVDVKDKRATVKVNWFPSAGEISISNCTETIKEVYEFVDQAERDQALKSLRSRLNELRVEAPASIAPPTWVSRTPPITDSSKPIAWALDWPKEVNQLGPVFTAHLNGITNIANADQINTDRSKVCVLVLTLKTFGVASVKSIRGYPQAKTGEEGRFRKFELKDDGTPNSFDLKSDAIHLASSIPHSTVNAAFLDQINASAVARFTSIYWPQLEYYPDEESATQLPLVNWICLVGDVPRAVFELDGRPPEGIRDLRSNDVDVFKQLLDQLKSDYSTLENIRGADTNTNRALNRTELAVCIGYLESLSKALAKWDKGRGLRLIYSRSLDLQYMNDLEQNPK